MDVRPLNDPLLAHPVSFEEERGGRYLLVWGDLGQWMVLDAEAREMLRLIEGSRSPGDAVRRYAAQRGLQIEAVEKASDAIIRSFRERGVLAPRPGPITCPEEPLSIANLTFNITNRCNLHCPWCYNGPASAEESPIKAFTDWVRNGHAALDADATCIVLGGEPFLDSARLLDALRGVKPYFGGELLVSTNGTLVTEADAAALADLGVTVQVSLDSTRPERHDALRGDGVFEKAVGAARMLAREGVRVVLSMVLTGDSTGDMEAYFELARSTGAAEVRFIPLRRIGRGAGRGGEKPDLAAAFETLRAILRRHPESARMLGRDFFSILMAVCRHSRHRTNCGIGRRVIFVDADGVIYPCPNHRRPEYRCGGVHDTPLGDLLRTSEVLRRVRDRFRVARISPCKACTFRFWCAGDCRAEAEFLAAGDQQSPSPYCKELQEIMKEMFWLIAEGREFAGIPEERLVNWD